MNPIPSTRCAPASNSTTTVDPCALDALYAVQQQSPLFRVPRELRDQIFDYCAYDDAGVLYDYGSKRLRYADETTHTRKMALKLACKAAAHELQGVRVMLRNGNTIVFTPGRSDRDCWGDYRGLRSKASRFENLIHYARWTKMLMLHYAARCVTSEILDSVADRFPGVAQYFRAAFHAIRDGFELFRMRGTDFLYRWQMSAAFCEALHYTLELASAHPDFDHLASQACSTSRKMRGARCFFHTGSHLALLAWNPSWWAIPSEAELWMLEARLTPPTKEPNDFEYNDDWTEDLSSSKWYFSATAVAVNFLKHLRREDRMRIRGRVIIKETSKGAAYPDCHAHGLLPYCLENPKLRIETHLSVWSMLMPSVWLERRASLFPPEEYSCPYLPADRFLVSIAHWLDETRRLFTSGMPVGSFSVVLEGQRNETLQVWDMAKHAASMQEAMAESNHVRQQKDIDLGLSVYHLLKDGPGECFLLLDRFLLPCYLPNSFAPAIRDIVQGTSVIKFNGNPGELHNTAAMIQERKHWSLLEYRDDWRIFQERTFIELPHGGQSAYCREYDI